MFGSIGGIAFSIGPKERNNIVKTIMVMPIITMKIKKP